MLDKLKFNNLVISNKKKIQQARTQTINKQVQKLRKLKSLLEKKPEDDKTKERMRKSIENIEQLKKMKEVDIMKQILLLDAKPSAVITNGRATPAEVGIALLALNKIMDNLTKEFRLALSLSESDDSWRKDITETSKRRTKIEHTEIKRRKRLELKEQKAMERKRTEWLEQNRPAEDKNDAETEQVAGSEGTEKSNNGAWKVEEATVVESVKPKTKVKPEKPKKAPTKKINATNSQMSKENPKQDKNKSTQKSLKRNQMEETAPVTKHQRINSSIVKALIKKEAEIEEVIEEPGITHVVDPFFITETGENYLSTAVTKLGENSDVDEEQDEQNAFSQRPFKRKQDRQQQQQHGRDERQGRYNNQQRTQDRYGRSEQHKKLDFQTKPEREGENKRHPSWVAKEKIKPVISKFEGKKITFGEDNKPTVQSIGHSGKNEQIPTNGKEVEGMHPSWVAKQKLKPKIAAFQGKKINFGNDDDE